MSLLLAGMDEKTRVVGNYILGDVIGQGSFGKVREAMDRTGRRVAVKKLSMERVKRARATDMVRQEVSISKQLQKYSHRHVVKTIEVIEQTEPKERLFIVMELVKGGTLQRLIDTAPSHRLDPDPMRSYFRHLMHGLAHIHEKGIVHRDVKPENLMITLEGVAKICDFGTAEQLDSFIHCGEPILLRTRGTPEFLAPEIASGCGSISGTAVDVWAAGITLYYALFATLPFQGRHEALFDAITNNPLPRPELPGGVDECPEELWGLIELMLCKDEASRATGQQVLQHKWCTGSAAAGFADPEKLYKITLPRVDANSVLPKISGMFKDESAATSFASEVPAAQAEESEPTLTQQDKEAPPQADSKPAEVAAQPVASQLKGDKVEGRQVCATCLIA